MKHVLSALALGLLLGAAAAYAADTGGSTAQPTASERVQTARDAIKSKDWKRAVAELKLAVRDEPRNADAHNLLGYSYRKQAKPDLAKAFEHYNTALKLDPKHKGAHEYIGEAYLIDKKPAEAEKHLAELEKLCGNKTCEEYADLFKAIGDYKTKTP
jgi:Flp pilus assembly protein TadD